MRKDRVIMAFDRSLAFLRAVHDRLADEDVENTQHHEDGRQPPVHRERGRNEQGQRHGGCQMRAHEFQPKPEQGLARAQKRMQRIGRPALMVPAERHRDDAAKGFGQKIGAPAMGQPVGLPRHQHEGDRVEHAEATPGDQHGLGIALLGDRIDDAAEEDRLDDGDHRQNDVGDHHQGHPEAVGSQIFEGLYIDLKQGQWCFLIDRPEWPSQLEAFFVLAGKSLNRSAIRWSDATVALSLFPIGQPGLCARKPWGVRGPDFATIARFQVSDLNAS